MRSSKWYNQGDVCILLADINDINLTFYHYNNTQSLVPHQVQLPIFRHPYSLPVLVPASDQREQNT